MIKKWFCRSVDALLISMVILGLFGAASEGWRQHQAQRPEKPADNIHTGWQPSVAPCLVEAFSVDEGCRDMVPLPECLAEDGSGPGVECWWRSNEGLTWYNDGSEDD